MGMYNAFIAAAKTIVTDPTSQSSFACVNKLRAYRDLQSDPAVPAAFAGANEVQSIPDIAGDAGTYTLTIRPANAAAFTTGNIDFDDNAAAIETIIDAAAAGVIPGFTAGDIAVAGTSIVAGPLTLTFDGASVAGTNPGLATVTSSVTLSAAPVTAPTVTVTTAGQTDRNGYAILAAIGVITMAAPPDFGAVPTVVAGPNHLNVAPWFVMAIAKEIAWQEGNPAILSTLAEALTPQQR